MTPETPSKPPFVAIGCGVLALLAVCGLSIALIGAAGFVFYQTSAAPVDTASINPPIESVEIPGSDDPAPSLDIPVEADGRAIGPADARVTIIEYYDFF